MFKITLLLIVNERNISQTIMKKCKKKERKLRKEYFDFSFTVGGKNGKPILIIPDHLFSTVI